jgi:cytidine deaminase
MDKAELIEFARTALRWRKLNDQCTCADVSAALLTSTGKAYRGVNLSAACGLGYCGETAAIAQMLTDGETRIHMLVAINTQGKLLPPCGRCRELLYQIDHGNLETKILLAGGKTVRLAELLPERWQEQWNGPLPG